MRGLSAQTSLLPVKVELVLRDGGLPDALGEAGGLGVPHIYVNVARIECTSRNAHLKCFKKSIGCIYV